MRGGGGGGSAARHGGTHHQLPLLCRTQTCMAGPDMHDGTIGIGIPHQRTAVAAPRENTPRAPHHRVGKIPREHNIFMYGWRPGARVCASHKQASKCVHVHQSHRHPYARMCMTHASIHMHACMLIMAHAGIHVCARAPITPASICMHMHHSQRHPESAGCSTLTDPGCR